MSETITVSAGRRTARKIRAQILVNGRAVPETRFEQFALSRTRYSRADTAEINLAVDRAALSKVTGNYWFDLAVTPGTATADTDVQIQMRDEAVTGAQWVTVFQGLMDHVEWTPTGTRLVVECRDYLAKLLDMRVQDAWLNKTGADLMTTLISASGLTPQVSFPASMTGQYWQIEHKRLSHSAHGRFQTAFDLARYIASSAGCDLYASGKTVVCKPYPTSSDGSATTHTLKYQDDGPDKAIVSNAMALSFKRDYQIAKGVVVHVMSWDSRQRAKFEYYWSAEGGSPKKAANAGTLHSFKVPGRSMQDVQNAAKQKYDEIVAHGREVHMTIPGRINLQPRDFFTLTGTNSTWDGQSYTVDAVSSSFSWEGGFQQDVTLRNRDVTQDEADDDA